MPEGNGHLFDVLAAPDGMRVLLASPNPRGHAKGLAWWSSSNGIWLAGDDLAPLPADRTYQLWVVPSERDAINLGTLHIDREGSGRMLATGGWLLTVPPDSPLKLLLTEEPLGGSSGPSSDVRLIGELPRRR
jgi:hypothetical protein